MLRVEFSTDQLVPLALMTLMAGIVAKKPGNLKMNKAMKKYTCIFAAALAFAACTKEANQIDEPIAEPANSEVHELFVSLPEITDDETKASINVADGKFSWAAGDQIAVVTSTSDVYAFTASADGASVRFTYTGEMNGTPETIKYPYKSDGTSTDLPTSISGLTGALESDNIRLTGTVTSNSATLSYENAFLKVTFTNVPTFASKISFSSVDSGYEQNITVSGITLADKGSVVAYFPVKAGSYSFTVSLIDSEDHTMFSQATTSAKTLVAGSLKKLASLPMGTLIMMSNSGSSYGGFSKMKVYNWWDGGSHNLTDPLTQITISGTKYGYYFLPASLAVGKEVNIKVENGDDSGNNTQTVVYNLRDITFTIKASNAGIATNYRYYFNNTGGWSQVNAYIWDEYNTAKNGTWPGGILTNIASNGWYYYEFDENEYGYTRHVKFSENGGTSGGNHENQNAYRDWYFEN